MYNCYFNKIQTIQAKCLAIALNETIQDSKRGFCKQIVELETIKEFRYIQSFSLYNRLDNKSE